ncbi:MAG: Kelch repeat-containing protein, partial [Candidatus Limnocylindria bacterium]
TPSASPSTPPGASVAASMEAAASPLASPSQQPAGWREVQAAGAAPMPREDHTWTLDGDGEIAYLFGGRDDASGHGAYADLWAYDLATDTWSQLSGGPPARFGHNAAWVPGVGLVVFAGQDAAFFNDLWAYDPPTDTWRVLPVTGSLPVPRYGSCAALGPDGRLWISHGFTSEGSRFADTWAYDFALGAWTEETPVGAVPVVRCLHACWWTDADRFTLYAGQTTGTTSLGDRWELTVGTRPGTNAWQELGAGPGQPVARNLYASARWDGQALVFGGQALDGSYLADTWRLADDGTYLELLPGAVGPSARSGAELVPDPERGRVLLFGGKAGASVFGDLWELIPG